MTPLLIRDIQNNKRTKFWILITPIYLVYLYFYMIINKKQIPFYQTYFPAWFIFYYIGLSVKINGYKFLYKNNQISISLIMCIVSFILSIFEGYMLLSLGLLESIASSQIKISTFLYTFTLIKLIMKIKLYSQDNKIKWLKYIGDNSYGIYYVHMFWIIISNRGLILIPSLRDILPIYQFIQLIFVLSFSFFSIYIIRMIIGRNLANKLFGF